LKSRTHVKSIDIISENSFGKHIFVKLNIGGVNNKNIYLQYYITPFRVSTLSEAKGGLFMEFEWDKNKVAANLSKQFD